jgi:outer membrane protein TolC
MNLNRVPHRRKFLEGTLASLIVLLFLNGPAVRAQLTITTSTNPTLVRVPESPKLPPPDVGPAPGASILGVPVAIMDDTPAARPMPNTISTEKALPPFEAEEGAEGTKKLNLQECIALAMQHQPALSAGNASLAAAQQAYQGLNGLPRFAGLLSRDLAVRKDQARWGIQIAQAGLAQAEWDTRYAVTRNYYSVVYARQQSELVRRIVKKLDDAHKRAQELLKAGEGTITKIDVDQLFVAREKTKARGLQASMGVRTALAALHEAIGIPSNQPLDIVDDKLPALVGDLEMQQLIAQALAQRGEMTQAQAFAQVVCLEVEAQRRMLFKPRAGTFALGADIHSTQIPQGLANGEYRPGAIPEEMPVNMVGSRTDRMERARAFYARAGAVAEKTENLISLEAKAAYWKWKEAAERLKIYLGDPAIREKDKENSLASTADHIADLVYERFRNGKVSGADYLQARGAADTMLVEYNEAVYQHALGLAALERVTAGGFRLTATQP